MKKILVISVTVLTLGAAILIISATVATLGAATLSSGVHFGRASVLQ